MANSVGNLFTKYSATYSKAGEEDAEREPLTPKELKKASRNELRGFEGDVLRVSKRGGNFLDRVMCWIEDRVFSLTRSGHPDSSRQSQSKEFSEDVKKALREIDVDTEGVDEHQLMKQIKSVQVRDLPLRSGFVQSILREVASLENASGKGRLPKIAKEAFLSNGEVARSKTPELNVDLLFSSPEKAGRREVIGVDGSSEGESDDDSVELSHSYSGSNPQPGSGRAKADNLSSIPGSGRAKADNLSSMDNGMFLDRLSDHVEEIVRPYVVTETQGIFSETSLDSYTEAGYARDTKAVAKVLTGRLARTSFTSELVPDFRVPLQQRAQDIYDGLALNEGVDSVVDRETQAFRELAREISAGREDLIEAYVSGHFNPSTGEDTI